MRRALVVGIDHYKDAPLSGCVNDATEIAALLEVNGDGSPNFSVKRLFSENSEVTSLALDSSLKDLFSHDAETVVFYFAGHGIVKSEDNSGYLVSQDGRSGSWGISLASLLGYANQSYPRIRSSVIILDSCQSGYAGELPGFPSQSAVSFVGSGVTILTACHREQSATEQNGHGLFTHLLIDAMRGGACDICGRITPAAIYAHVDQTLGPWEQRPVYKANVQSFVVLRTVSAKIPLEILRKLPIYFPSNEYEFRLDPSFEPDRGEKTEEFRDIKINIESVGIYRELQMCYRNGLVMPKDQPHMWHAAMNSTGCKLTALGAHYRKLAELKRI